MKELKKMKKNNLINGIAILFILFFLPDKIKAQSDYEIVQNYKQVYQQIEEEISGAAATSELMEISSRIDKLEQGFRDHRNLLDKSLYPKTFKSSLEDLRLAVNLRKDDFVQIDVLQTEVIGLKDQINFLNQRNNELLNQIQILESESKKDKSRIVQLERSITELRISLKKRDELVFNMIDSLLPPSFRSKDELTLEEKEKVYSDAERSNIIVNVKRALKDHISFLDVTTLTSEDIENVKEQQEQFSKIWKNVGPKLVDAYSNKGENTNDLREIDSAFNIWHNKINKEAWESIHEEFALNNINLQKFSSGKTFTESITSYITDEMRSAEAKGEKEAENNYNYFADSVWSDIIKPQWMTYLTDNKMITEQQKDSIETRISDWKAAVYPSQINWLYFVIGILVIAVIFLLFKKRKPEEPKTGTETTP
jgi:hypothetical protein